MRRFALVLLSSVPLALSAQQDAPRLLGRHPLPVMAVAVSPDGATVASASGAAEDGALHGEVRLWNLASGKLVRTLTGPRGGVFYSVAYSPDGRALAAGSMSGAVMIWDPRTGAVQRELTGPTGPARALGFSWDGRWVAVASVRSPVLRLWNAETGAPLPGIVAHAGGVMALSWSHDGLLATVGRDRTLKVWEPTRGALLSTIEGASDRSFGVAFANDGLTIAIAGPEVVVVNLASGQSRALGAQPNTVSTVAYSLRGQRLLTATGDPEVVPGGTQKIAGLPEFQVAAPDASGTALTASRQGIVRVYDASSGLIERELTARTDYVWSAVFSPDGRSIVTGNADGSVGVWDLGG